jgi:uncharacterized protein (DUF433 family)
VIKGTRIAVDLVLEDLSHNPDINELLVAHPDLSRAEACLAYAKDIMTGKDVSQSHPRELALMPPYEIPPGPEC